MSEERNRLPEACRQARAREIYGGCGDAWNPFARLGARPGARLRGEDGAVGQRVEAAPLAERGGR